MNSNYRPLEDRPEAQAYRLQRLLQKALARPVSVTPTNNRVRLMSTRTRGRVLEIRIQQGLLRHAIKHIDIIVAYLASPNSKTRAKLRVIFQLTEFHPEESRKTKIPPLRPKGAYYDLNEHAALINEVYFSSTLSYKIGWSRQKNPRRGHPPRSIVLGRCNRNDSTVALHLILDQEKVPVFFLRFVIYHEFLHLAIPFRVSPSGRKIIHGKDFRERERQYAQFSEAKRWEKDKLPRLIREWYG
mgnify:CR=1 FL=1